MCMKLLNYLCYESVLSEIYPQQCVVSAEHTLQHLQGLRVYFNNGNLF